MSFIHYRNLSASNPSMAVIESIAKPCPQPMKLRRALLKTVLKVLVYLIFFWFMWSPAKRS